MMKTAITMPSVTHAIKARRALARGGIRSEIRRAPKVSENGCTHILIADGDKYNIISFLNRMGIEYGKPLDGYGAHI